MLTLNKATIVVYQGHRIILLHWAILVNKDTQYTLVDKQFGHFVPHDMISELIWVKTQPSFGIVSLQASLNMVKIPSAQILNS